MAFWLRVIVLNTMFWVLCLGVTAVFAVVGAIYVGIFGLCVRSRRRTLRLIRLAIGHYGAAVLRCAWPLVRVAYVDHAPGDKPPFVFVANHRSSSDAYLMSFLPFECILVAKIWPFRIPFLGFVAKLAGYLSIQEMSIEKFIECGSRLLAEGVSVIIFPEGTRSRTGAMGPFYGSAFRLAVHAGAKVVPVVISGNQNIPRRGSLWLFPGRVAVHKLPAICIDEFKDQVIFKLKMFAHKKMELCLNSLEAGTA